MALVNPVPRQNLEGFDDAHIVALAQAGNEAAFREIMRRNNRRLFRVARTVVRDAGEAEDVVQEAYLKAFAGLASFRGEALLSTWLTRITLNEALQRRRRQRQTIELGELDHASSSGANILVFPMLGTDNPEAAAARAQLRGLLERAVDDLPASFRLVRDARPRGDEHRGNRRSPQAQARDGPDAPVPGAAPVAQGPAR